MRDRTISSWLTARYRLVLLGCGAVLMLAPAAAMRFTDEVRWGAEDFGAAAGLFAILWLAFEIIFNRIRRGGLRFVLSAAAAVAFLATWAHLAVGF